MTTATAVPATVSAWKIDPPRTVAEFRVKHMTISNVKKRVQRCQRLSHPERGRSLLAEGAQAGVVLRPRLAQAVVALDDLHDIGLLLHGLGKIGYRMVSHDKRAGAVIETVEGVESAGSEATSGLPAFIQGIGYKLILPWFNSSAITKGRKRWNMLQSGVSVLKRRPT